MPQSTGRIVKLVIQGPRQAGKDLRKSWPTYIVLVAIILAWIFGSAGFWTHYEVHTPSATDLLVNPKTETKTWDYDDSLYFTVINVTTVGFGDIA